MQNEAGRTGPSTRLIVACAMTANMAVQAYYLRQRSIEPARQ